MRSFTAPCTTYLMPNDAAVAQAALISLLRRPAEKWLQMYEASMPDFYESLIHSHHSTTPVHIYVDYSLARRPNEHRKLCELKAAGVDMVIGTSTVGRYFIAHAKNAVISPVSPSTVYDVWEGSVNFSPTSWNETNTAVVISDNDYAADLIAQWNELAAFARSAEPDLQI